MKTDNRYVHHIGRLCKSAMIPSAFVFVTGFIHNSNAGSSGQNIGVSSQVSANCKISGSTSPIAFGDYDPTHENASQDLDSTGSFQISCTKGISAALTIDNGTNFSGYSRRAIGQVNATNYLNYELYTSPARETVWDGTVGGTVTYVATSAAKTTITIYASVPGGQDVEVQNYTDTVTITSTF